MLGLLPFQGVLVLGASALYLSAGDPRFRAYGGDEGLFLLPFRAFTFFPYALPQLWLQPSPCLFLLFEIMFGFKLSHFEIYLWELAILRLERNRVIQSFYLHRSHTLRNHVDFFGGSPGKVDDSSPSERTTVDNFYDYTLVVSQIRNLQHRAEGIITVCTRQTVMVDSLSTCRPGTRGTFRVKGCLATLMLLAAAWDA